ncbi:hypothetical protein O181_009721 [Austropuccinia psidii MF-1]|uniref:DUF4939 domain-containing protein n=1 Tax=Austropuccinia psidii MF-1 TaxID=1389203 RepID=A0A9Q3GJQ8_9BASI|nr:hypothetical protein [Austropuccinia psidii MF-1]
MEHGLQPTGHRGHREPKWPKKAIQPIDPLTKGGGPKALDMDRGSRGPWKTEWIPQAQNKCIGLGVIPLVISSYYTLKCITFYNMLSPPYPPAKNKRSQRHQAVPTPTARAPLKHTPSVHKLSENLDRGPLMKVKAPFGRGGPRSRFGEAEDEEGEESEESEGATTLAGAPEASEAANLAHSDQPLVSQAEQNFLKIMEQITQLMGQLTQAVSPRDNSKAASFKTPSMKAPDSFDGTQAHKLRVYIQFWKLILHNYPANFFSERNKVLYSTSFLIGRACKWIESYLSKISNKDFSYLLSNWKLFKTQLLTLFGDPNEFRKADQELDSLRMK